MHHQHKNESTGHKCKLLFIMLFVGAIAATGCWFNYHYYQNAKTFESDIVQICEEQYGRKTVWVTPTKTTCEKLEDGDVEIFNVWFLKAAINDDWTDKEQASQYIKELKEDCGDDDLGDCFEDGMRWTLLYRLNGWVLILIACNSLAMGVGLWCCPIRMIACCLHFCLKCAITAALITTAVYRWNKVGRLAALSNTHCWANGIASNGKEVTFDDEITYAWMAKALTYLFILYCFVCCCMCFGSWMFSPSKEQHEEGSKQSQVDSNTFNNEREGLNPDQNQGPAPPQQHNYDANAMQ